MDIICVAYNYRGVGCCIIGWGQGDEGGAVACS